MSDPTLYGYWRSSCSYRVRIVLNLKGLSYEQHPLHLVKDGGQQRRDAYRRLNPMGLVPCLVDGDLVLGESMAIIEYLDARHPNPRLFPGEPRATAKVRQACEIINAGTQPLQNLGVLEFLKNRLGADDDAIGAWNRHWIQKGLLAFQETIKATAGTYSFGDTLTAADAFLIPQLYNADRWGVDPQPLATLYRIRKVCQGLKAFRDAHPANQPDAPQES